MRNIFKKIHKYLTMNLLDIKKTRRDLNLSQTAFGKLFGVGIRTVQLWESGERTMTNSVKIILENYSYPNMCTEK